MNIYKIFLEFNLKKFIYIIFLGISTGLLNASILILINSQIQIAFKVEDNYKSYYPWIFFIALIFFLVTRKLLTSKQIWLAQELKYKLRLNLVQDILATNYKNFHLVYNKLHTSLTSDITTIVNSFNNFIPIIISFVTVFACFIYLGILSFKLLIVTIFVLLLATSIYWLNDNKNMRFIKLGRNLEDRFYQIFTHIIFGFKEIKVDSKKGDEIFHSEILKNCERNKFYYIKGLTGYINNSIIGRFFLFLFLGNILFLNSKYLNLEIELIINYILILLYLIGPIEHIVTSLPDFKIANISATRVYKLKNELLSKSIKFHYDVNPQKKWEKFENLSLVNVYFNYEDLPHVKKNFGIGPINLTINKNEIVFICGGNGSGKSTFMKILLGLYQTTSGLIKVNSELINYDTNKNYLQLFSPVFSDYHIFDKLYGIKFKSYKEINYYLQLFELSNIVQIIGNGFSHIKLSSAQRKRLALIIALLEDKPIIVLDEWAAEQDFSFKAKFYTKILPCLKNKGFTIIAITHDEKYFPLSDRLLKMENGELFVIENKTNS